MMIGFVGLGLMGEPMARNLLRAGAKLMVWNRTAGKCAELAAQGASVAANQGELFTNCEFIVLMLKDEAAIDDVLDRNGSQFANRVHGRTIIQSGTVSPSYSAQLAASISRAGGRYVEAPVSGSRGPAETGELVCMLAGDAATVSLVAACLQPVASSFFFCGEPPKALQMKLAVNHFLITMVSSLCEAYNFARLAGLNTELFRAILDAGPMSSAVSRAKLAKLVARDFSPQASLADVLKNADLVYQENREVEAMNPLLAASRELVREGLALGGGDKDMAGTVFAFEKG